MSDFFDSIDNKIIIGLLIAVVGAGVAYLLNLSRQQRDRFAQVCADFRNAFSTEIDFLKDENTSLLADGAYEVLLSALPKHEKAYRQLKPYLFWFQRKSLDKAWNRYLYPCGYKKQHEPLTAYLMGDGHEHELASRKLALAKVEKLLAYAKAT